MKHFDQTGKENAAGAAKPMHNIMKDALRFTLLMQVPNHYTKGVMPLKLGDPFWCWVGGSSAAVPRVNVA